jgi:hypothetical protein
MPLVTPVLIAGVTKAMMSSLVPGTTRAQVADRISSSYDTYAKAAVSCGAFPIVKINKSKLQSQLQKTMTKNSPNVSVAAREWGAAFEAYWLGGTFGGGGTVTLVPGKPALIAALSGIWRSGVTGTTPNIARKIANALDVFTRLVVVTSPLPGTGCVGPIV